MDFETIQGKGRQMDPKTWYDWVDDALRHKADYVMPPKNRIAQEDGDYYNIMPVWLPKDNLVMVKTIGRHNLKAGEQRPAMMGDLLLYEADTGKLKALMDAEYITTLRTGAVAAHSAWLFSRKDTRIIGLLGLGNIMTVFFLTFLAERKARKENTPLEIRLYKHHGQEERFQRRFSGETNLRFVFCDTYEETIDGADLVVSAVTRATQNFVPDSCYKKGVTVIPICTLGFQNCDLFFDQVFTDEIEQIRGFKYFERFRSVANVSDVLNGVTPGRRNDEDRILVYNYGIGIHDLYFAEKFSHNIKGNECSYHSCTEKYFI